MNRRVFTNLLGCATALPLSWRAFAEPTVDKAAVDKAHDTWLRASYHDSLRIPVDPSMNLRPSAGFDIVDWEGRTFDTALEKPVLSPDYGGGSWAFVAKVSNGTVSATNTSYISLASEARFLLGRGQAALESSLKSLTRLGSKLINFRAVTIRS
jgi:hypothetical protein